MMPLTTTLIKMWGLRSVCHSCCVSGGLEFTSIRCFLEEFNSCKSTENMCCWCLFTEVAKTPRIN